MRCSPPVFALVATVAVLALFLGQLWLWERQRQTQQAAIALRERILAQHQAELKAWQARPRPQPGRPPLPPPALQLLPALHPPVFFPWWLFCFPLLMGPAAYAALAEQRRLRQQQEHE